MEKTETTQDPDYTIECSECGHEHFNTMTRTYSTCPLWNEGCHCRMDDSQ